MRDARYRPVDFVDRKLEIEHRPDGSIILTNPNPLEPPARNLIEPFRKWATERPDQTFLAQRDTSGAWRHLTYGQANARVDAIAQALINRGLGWGQARHGVLMILSGNSIEHALMTYGAILAGVPVAPVSRAYSLMSTDHAKLKYVADMVEPRMFFVQDGRQFEPALASLDLSRAEIVCAQNPPERFPASDYADLASTTPGPDVERIFQTIGHDHVAKYLFTSGSTGTPKAVINTHRMMCYNAQMNRAMLADREPPVTLNWLPWNHTFGANSVLNGTLSQGGTLYIDDGLPTPDLFHKTLANLREISPTTYSNVPAGYAMLIAELEKDPALATSFFRRLKTLSYGGAALNQDLHDRIQAVAEQAVGHRIPFLTGYGSTETAPVLMSVHWTTDRVGLIGLPLPGVEVKLVPVGGKYEVWARGPSITPGYYKMPDLTAQAFDRDGFYALGDAAKFLNPEDPAQGLVFDGRIKEDFKLDTGTFVNAGRLRLQAIEASDGIFQDCLVAGHDRAFVGVLGFPNLVACRDLTGDATLSPAGAATHPRILEHVRDGLVAHNRLHPGSSTQIRRALILTEPASLDAGELTDKGYINQHAALERRQKDVERLYADPPGNAVIVA